MKQEIHEQAVCIAIEILREMDRVQEKTLWWNTYHVGRITSNVHMAIINGIPFTEKLITALALGEEDTKEIVAFKEKIPTHYDFLNLALDDISTNQPDRVGEEDTVN